MKEEFSTLDIVKGMGIPRERLREWMTRGFISPSIQAAQGQGTKALFSRADLYRIGLFKYLVERGFMRHAASGYVNQLNHIDLLSSEYIGFRFSDKVVPDVTPETDSVAFIMNQNTDVDLTTGAPKSKTGFAIEDKIQKYVSDSEFYEFTIINFRKIRRDVDRMIG
jgi:hypothetical protein